MPKKISEFERDYCRRNDIPLPTRSAAERLREMAAFRPAHFLHQTKCAKTGKAILSSVPPAAGINVYDIEVWLSGDWDARSYGRDYDFSRPFFEQFRELMHSVPFPSLSAAHASLENCPYCNFISASKNCYLIYSGQQLEDCLYGRFLYNSRDILDSFYVRNSELCYACRDVQDCYNLIFSDGCQSCSDSAFLDSCRSCRDCYGCVNLSNKQFCWFNEQLAASEWRKRRAAVDLGSSAVLTRERALFHKFASRHPLRCIRGESYEGSSGNFLNQVKDCRNCFLVSESESLENCIWVNRAKSSLVTLGFGIDSELLYHSTGVGTSAYNIKFSAQCRVSVRDLEYCMLAESGTQHCFGCVSIRNGRFCILNKQYSEAEYFDLLPRVKAHMRQTGEYGHFFPRSLNPYAYNQSDAALFFPLEKAAAESLGYSWSAESGVSARVDGSPLPGHVQDAGDEVLGQTFLCQESGKSYRIQKKELEFLRRMNVALPSVAPFERIRRTGEFLEWREARAVTCAACSGSCGSIYDPTKRSILCEACYQNLLLDGSGAS